MACLDTEAHLDHRYPIVYMGDFCVAFTVSCIISCFLLYYVFQGPPGIAGLPVSTTEDVLCCLNAVVSNVSTLYIVL